MYRRSFFGGLLGGGFGCGSILSRGERQDRFGGAGRYMIVAKATYGTPCWNGRIRVKGTRVLFNSYAPEG